MAESSEIQKTLYPLPAYNFRVTVDGETMGFTEVLGLSLEYETLTYRHGMSFWEGEGIKKYYFDKYVPVTLKKGTMMGANALYDWISQKDNATHALEVSLCNEAGLPVVTWRIAKAVPVKLEAPTFDADTNAVSIESLELMVAGISIIHH